MKKAASNTPTQLPSTRRLGRIVHDERGAASIEWFDAPPDHEYSESDLQKLDINISIELEPAQAQVPQQDCDPYAHSAHAAQGAAGKKPRRDLRKLSEWIKTKRRVEAEKLGGGESCEEPGDEER